MQPLNGAKMIANAGMGAAAGLADGLGMNGVADGIRGANNAMNWAHCHVDDGVKKQVDQWGDDIAKNADNFANGCGGSGSFKTCLNAVNEAKNTEVLRGTGITVGDGVAAGANVVAPGSGKFVEGASAAMDVAGAVTNTLDDRLM